MEALRAHMNAVEELHRPLQEGEPENRIVFSISNGYQLTENDMDYFMGSGGGYPANAKNEAEFRMWESVDFVEIDDTRIMVRSDDLPDSYEMFDDEDDAEYDDEDDNDSFDF